MIWLYIVAAFEIAGIVSALFAVMSTRTPQGAIAWAVSLITLPYVAVPLYWIFGRDKFRGYVMARQEKLDAVNEALAETAAELRKHALASGVDEGRIRSAERLARMPASGNNRIELLIDGEATFESILSGIDAAERYVLVQFYILRHDGLGTRLKDRLIARAKDGVRVYVLYDEIGSFGLSTAYLDEMHAAGIDIRPFNTRKGRVNRFQLNFRNHRKIVIVDGKTCWIGGHNVGDEYLGLDPKFGNWRDTHVRIEGPATLAAQVSFIEDWQWASDSIIPDLNWQPFLAEAGDTALLIAPSGPADELETASLLHTQVINTAQERLWIASPYFVPDHATIAALQLACLRGVDVRIIVPDKTDNALVTYATYIYFQLIAPCGAKFYRYTDGFMHQKVFLVDDRIAAVGTANFDNRSFRLNFEITTIAGPGEFHDSLEKFEADFARSVPMPFDAYTSKPAWFRLAARVSRLTSPIL